MPDALVGIAAVAAPNYINGTGRTRRSGVGVIVGLDDITKKAKDFLADNRVKDALASEQAEGVSDKVLGGTADTVNKVTGGKFEEQVEGARAEADKKIGNE